MCAYVLGLVMLTECFQCVVLIAKGSLAHDSVQCDLT